MSGKTGRNQLRTRRHARTRKRLAGTPHELRPSRVPGTVAIDYLRLAPLLWARPEKTVGDVIACSGVLYQRLVHPLLLAALNIDPNDGAAVLAAAGLTFADVVKTTIFLVDMNDFAAVNTVYGDSFEDGRTPARSTVAVAALPRGARVEIEAIALRREA